jgi:hypothetical protein
VKFKECSKCKSNKKMSEFHFKKTENRYNSWCKSCVYKLQKNRWKLRKLKAISLFGGKCTICGYDRNISALAFHHKNPKQKDFNWNKLRLLKWSTIIEELKKCQLVCSNCHMELHNPDCFKDVRELVTSNYDYNILINKELSPTGSCPYCGENVYGTKYCSVQHAALGNRKTNRPSIEQLKKDIENNTWVAIGKKYSVSDNTVRKWAKQYGLI